MPITVGPNSGSASRGSDFPIGKTQSRASLITVLTGLDSGAAGLQAASSQAEFEVATDEISREAKEWFERAGLRVPMGILQQCFLGAPHDVHTLDPMISIIDHYTPARILPNGLEIGRAMARRSDYSWVEVYADCLVLVTPSGQPIYVIGGGA